MFLTILFIFTIMPNVFAMSYDQASSQGKPVVLYFYMKGCRGCANFKPIFDALSSKYSSKFAFADEDLRKTNMPLRAKVNAVPRVYIVEPLKKTAAKITNECVFNSSCMEQTLDKYPQK